MIHALTKQIAAVSQEYFNVNNVYASLDESAEFINIANRQLQMNPTLNETAIFSIFNKPILFVKVTNVSYDEGRSGYRRGQTGYSLLATNTVNVENIVGNIITGMAVGNIGMGTVKSNTVIFDNASISVQSNDTILTPWTQTYVSLKVLTVKIEYDIILYSLFTKQSLDLVNYFMFLPRATSIQAIINSNIIIDIPVSMLIMSIYESNFDFNLAGRGIKVYKVGGKVEALSYILPMSVSGGQGEQDFLTYWTIGNINQILYSPLKEISVDFIEGKAMQSDPQNYENMVVS